MTKSSDTHTSPSVAIRSASWLFIMVSILFPIPLLVMQTEWPYSLRIFFPFFIFFFFLYLGVFTHASRTKRHLAWILYPIMLVIATLLVGINAMGPRTIPDGVFAVYGLFVIAFILNKLLKPKIKKTPITEKRKRWYIVIIGVATIWMLTTLAAVYQQKSHEKRMETYTSAIQKDFPRALGVYYKKHNHYPDTLQEIEPYLTTSVQSDLQQYGIPFSKFIYTVTPDTQQYSVCNSLEIMNTPLCSQSADFSIDS